MKAKGGLTPKDGLAPDIAEGKNAVWALSAIFCTGGNARKPNAVCLRRHVRTGRENCAVPGIRAFIPNGALKHRFAERLQLTDEQKAQIEQFRKEDMAQMEPLFKQMDDLRAKADKLREENKARFESVLTDEQKEILAAMHERRAEMHKRRVSGQERRAEMKESWAEMWGRRAEMKESRAETQERRSAMQEQRVSAVGQRDVQGKKQPERTQPAEEEAVSAE